MFNIKALAQWVWQDTSVEIREWKLWLIRTARISFALIRDFADGQLSLRAMSLVYGSLLSLVPTLALAFAVLKGLDVHEKIQPLLLTALEPLGSKAIPLVNQLFLFVDNIKVGVLGIAGLLALLLSVISLLNKIEQAFNEVWRTYSNYGIWRRLGQYISLLLLGPFMIFLATGLTNIAMESTWLNSIMRYEVAGAAWLIFSWLVPYLLLIAGCTFLYIFIPNTVVNKRSAFGGAIVAALFWKMASAIFASFVMTSASYEAIYSGFAILIVLLLWLYTSWLILLFGANIAFYLQHPSYLSYSRPPNRFNGRTLERMALAALALIATRHYSGREPWSAAGMARRLDVPLTTLREVLNNYVAAQVLLKTEHQPSRYAPAKDYRLITLYELLNVVRAADEQKLPASALASLTTVEKTMQELENQIALGLKDKTMADLILPPK